MNLPQRRNHSDGSGDDAQLYREMTSNSGSTAYPEQPSLGDHVERILDLVQRRRWTIMLTCLLIVALGALYTYSKIPVYQSSSLVLVNSRTESASQLSASRGDLFARGDQSLENELMILRTSQVLERGVAERLVERSDEVAHLIRSRPTSKLDRFVDSWASALYSFLGMNTPSTADDKPVARSAPGSLSVPEVASVVGGSVQFSRASREASVLRITARHPNPELAAIIANTYTKEYLERTQRSSRAQLSASREFLEKQVQKRRQELQQIEQEIQQFKSQQGALALDSEGSNLVSRIAQTEASRDEARLELRMAETSLESLREEMQSISPDQLSRRVSSAVEQEIEQIQSRIAELELSKRQLLLQSDRPSASDSAQAAQIERRIQSLRSEADSLSKAYVDEVMEAGLSADQGVQRVRDLKRQIAEKRIEIAGLKSRIEVLSERLTEYESELRSIPEQSMQLAQLERRRTYTEQMYASLIDQLQQVRVQEESELGYADTVSEASVPGGPVQPNHNRNLMLSLILGLLGGLGAAIFRDQLDNRVYKPDRIGKMGYREVGVIPNLTPLIRDQIKSQEDDEDEGYQLSTSLVSAVLPQSAAAESYRHIRTNIQFNKQDRSMRTLLVTSPGAGDGKSVTAANLAIVMAQAGQSTLLIDTDLRRPQVHKLFGMYRSPGLTEALEGSLKERIQDPGVENLSVLPAGANGQNPSELLNSSKFRDVIEELRGHFDTIILDTPPVLAVTDAALLSPQCDASLCVVRAGATTEPELDRAMQVLEDVGANVMGAIFNGFDISMAYGYKYRYRYYGRYGPYDQYHALPDA